MKKSSCYPGKTRDAVPASPPKEDDMKEKLLASAALVLLACARGWAALTLYKLQEEEL